MSDCDHSFSGDDICNSCGYSIGYLLINAEQEIAALKAELARAREALIDAWFESEPGSRYQWQIAAIRANAEARYAREIAHAHKGEEG